MHSTRFVVILAYFGDMRRQGRQQQQSTTAKWQTEQQVSSCWPLSMHQSYNKKWRPSAAWL